MNSVLCIARSLSGLAVIIVSVVLISFSAVANPPVIKEIKRAYGKIERARKAQKLHMVETEDPSGESSEGSVIQWFYNKEGRLVLAFEGACWGMGCSEGSYYFREDGSLFFAFLTERSGAGAACAPDCGEPSVSETRLYFDVDGTLIRWREKQDGKDREVKFEPQQFSNRSTKVRVRLNEMQVEQHRRIANPRVIKDIRREYGMIERARKQSRLRSVPTSDPTVQAHEGSGLEWFYHAGGRLVLLKEFACSSYECMEGSYYFKKNGNLFFVFLSSWMTVCEEHDCGDDARRETRLYFDKTGALVRWREKNTATDKEIPFDQSKYDERTAEVTRRLAELQVRTHQKWANRRRK